MTHDTPSPLRSRLPSVAAAAVVALVTLRGVAPAADPPAADAAKWVRQLGDPSFAAREEAQRNLLKLPRHVVDPHLAAAAKSTDPEVRARAAAVVAAFDLLDRDRLIVRMGRAVKQATPDLFVEQVGTWKHRADDPVWRAAYALGGRLLQEGNVLIGLPRDTPFDDPLLTKFDPAGSYWRDVKISAASEAVLTEEGLYLWRGRRLRAGSRAVVPVVVGTESIELCLGRTALAYTNGDIVIPNDASAGATSNVIMVCGGSFRSQATDENGRSRRISLARCLIVAARDVHIRECSDLTGCAILAGGDVHIGGRAMLFRSTVRAGGRVVQGEKILLDRTKVEEKHKDPLSPIRFFDLSHIGVSVAAAGKSVTISALQPDSPLRAAGAAVGDVIVSAGGTNTATPEAVRVALRAAYARGSGTLTLLRGDTTRDIHVTFPD